MLVQTDYVRLQAGHAPPHWQKGGEQWDAGYQTTGYFLNWIEDFYPGAVRQINGAMRDKAYDEKIFEQVTERSVDKLWRLYKASLEEKSAAQ